MSNLIHRLRAAGTKMQIGFASERETNELLFAAAAEIEQLQR